MIEYGEVTGREIKKNADSDKKVLMLQVKMTEDDDVIDAEYYLPFGEDSSPVNGARVAVFRITPSFIIAINSESIVEPESEPGEKEIFSTDENGIKKAFIKFLTDGKIKINGEGDFLVRFNELKNGFNQLRDDFDGHKHKYTSALHPGPPADTLPPTPSSADISAAKIDELEVAP